MQKINCVLTNFSLISSYDDLFDFQIYQDDLRNDIAESQDYKNKLG